MDEKSAGCGKGYFYQIGKGETLAGIAGRLGLSLCDLLLANPYLDPNYYLAGQTIVIPYNTDLKRHVVTGRETLADVLRRYSTDIKTLRRINPGRNILELSVDMEINVPELPDERRYVISDSDTLSGIATKFGLEEIQLLQRNPHLRPGEFTRGQSIRV